jgi:hypothetical protein
MIALFILLAVLVVLLGYLALREEVLENRRYEASHR